MKKQKKKRKQEEKGIKGDKKGRKRNEQGEKRKFGKFLKMIGGKFFKMYGTIYIPVKIFKVWGIKVALYFGYPTQRYCDYLFVLIEQ